VPTLVFDGDCAFCTKCVGLIPKKAAAQLTVVPWQFADLAALGLTPEQCITALQFVDDGHIASGHAAVASVLRRSSWPLRLAGAAMMIPPVSWLAALTYRVVAANRQRLPGGTAACALPRDDAKSH
jgi:predicted DCC family thiol-disulfide oxidoreductase YuxK